MPKEYFYPKPENYLEPIYTHGISQNVATTFFLYTVCRHDDAIDSNMIYAFKDFITVVRDKNAGIQVMSYNSNKSFPFRSVTGMVGFKNAVYVSRCQFNISNGSAVNMDNTEKR